MMRFLLKTLFIHALVVLLVDGNRPVVSSFLIQSAFADGNAGQEEMQHLYSTYAGLKGRTKNGVPDVEGITNELMSPRGKEMLDKAQAFIGNPANRAVLATPEGQELTAMHNRFSRMRRVKSKLDSCFTGSYAELKEFNQMLPERIFGAAFMTPEGSISCDPKIFSTTSLDSLFGGVGPIVNDAAALERVDALTKLQKDIANKNVENAVQSMVTLKYTYSGKDPAQGAPLSDADLNGIVDKICKPIVTTGRNSKTTQRCSDPQKANLRKIAKEKQERLMGDNAPTFTKKQAADKLKEQFTNLNSKLMTDEFRFEVDYKWKNEIDREHPKSKRAIENYTREYTSILSGHPGMLAMTDSIAESVGSNRESDGAVMGIFGSGGADLETASFRPHPVSDLETDRTCSKRSGRTSTQVNCGEQKIKDAISEAESKILSQAYGAASAHKEAVEEISGDNYNANKSWNQFLTNGPSDIVENREATLTELVKTNPTSVGQVLLNDPSLTGEACQIMRKVAQETKEDGEFSWVKAALLVGGLALGAIALVGIGALIVGGIGIMAGAAGGAAAVAWGSSTLTMLALPGLVYGVAESTDAAVRWNQAQKDREAIAAAYFAGGSDEQAIGQYWNAVEDANNAAWELGLALGFTILDAPAVIGVARLMDGAQGVKYLRDVSKMFNYIEGSRKLRNLFKGIKGSMNLADFRKVMKQITKLDNGLDYIKKIENLSLDEAKALFKTSHRICVRSCS